MRFQAFRPAAYGLLVALHFAFLGSGCKPSHDDAKKIKRVESELNVPNASEKNREASDALLEWHMETLVDAYDKVGSKNTKWNSYARDALKIFAQVQAYGVDIEGYPALPRGYAARAIALGCDDPMIKYLNARLGDWSNTSAQEYAKYFTDASDALENSQYPTIRKFFGSLRAYNALRKIKPFPQQEGYTYLSRTTEHLYALLEDRKTPAKVADSACGEFLEINDWGDRKERYDHMEALLNKNWRKHAFSYLMQGEFYLDYAWVGRTGKYANEVTQEQWDLFFERLKIADERLHKGMELDQKEGRIPALMIKVVSGQNKGLPEMRNWWKKAMEIDPNNYKACNNLLYYLMPRWYGSREDMVAFGRECYESDKWGGTVPLILSEAHRMYNRYDGPKDGSYWKEPDVWPDIKASFDKFFRLNPNAISWRHNYAWFAYACEQWETLDEQLKSMGDNINYEYFGGEDKFNEMVKRTKAEMAKK